MESDENKCRICLEDNVELDWNHLLDDYGQLTYRDCYFKYTQLEHLDDDNFSTMLCRNCSNGLEYIDGFISKALETHIILQERLHINIIIKDMSEETNIDLEMGSVPSEDLQTAPVEIKACSIIESSTIPLTQNQKYQKRESIKRATKTKKNYDKQNSKVCKNKSMGETKNSAHNSMEISSNERINIEPGHFIDIANFQSSNCSLSQQQHGKNCKVELSSGSKKGTKKANKSQSLPNTSFEVKYSNKLTKSATTNKTENKGNKYESLKQNDNEDCITESEVPSTINQPNKAKKKILLCQYCSFKTKGTSQLKKHEATHNENRKRTETCPKCGIKLFTKSTLSGHMRIHDENRQKNHKCEFCDKAFYNKGTLNVHRRIHLGLMVKCQICQKEFFRKTELERHMNSHSATLINVEPKKRSRYLVRCTYCNKSIMSTSFKAHTAAHLNEPLLKCTICSKEFFRRDSCTDHLKLTHKKRAEEYNQFIISYRKHRLSHLYLEQTAELQAK